MSLKNRVRELEERSSQPDIDDYYPQGFEEMTNEEKCLAMIGVLPDEPGPEDIIF